MLKKILFLSLALSLALPMGRIVNSEEIQVTVDADAVADQLINELSINNIVTAKDLGDVSTGWFANLWRDVKLVFIRDPLRKAELELEKASVEMLKLQESLQEHANDSGVGEQIQKRLQKHQKLITKITERIQAYQNESSDSENFSKFLDKFTDQELKHQQIMQHLQTQVSEDVAAHIEANRERHLEQFGEVMNKVQNIKQFSERIKNNLENEDTKLQQRIANIPLLEELEGVDEELAEKIKIAIEKHQELWEEFKTQHEVMKNEREAFRAKVKAEIQNVDDDIRGNAEARQKLFKNLEAEREQIRIENQGELDKIREKLQENRNEMKELQEESGEEVGSSSNNRNGRNR